MPGRRPSPAGAAAGPDRGAGRGAPSARSPSGEAQGAPCRSISAISIRSPISAACCGTSSAVTARIARGAAAASPARAATAISGRIGRRRRARSGGDRGDHLATRHRGDRGDHLAIADRQRLAAVGGHRIEGGATIGSDRDDAGERPVAERLLLEVGEHQRAPPEGDDDLARGRVRALPPEPDRLEPQVSVERRHPASPASVRGPGGPEPFLARGSALVTGAPAAVRSAGRGVGALR